MTSKLEHALMLAMDGYYLFPLIENGKIPEANHNWRQRSTRDTATINSWFKDPYMGWEQSPNIGIDCGKSGIYVIDVDTKDGKHGDKTFQELDIEYGFTPTRESRTASGGRHLIYKNFELRNTASKLGKDIDTRGIGGFIVAPGSEIDGKIYEWVDRREAALLPAWVSQKLSDYKFKADSYDGKDTISEDDPEDIKRAIDWLEGFAEHAVEGAGGDHTTYATAAKLREFGCSADTALELMLEHWNNECSPPWDTDDLERKIHNAFQYAQKATGASSLAAEFDEDEEPPASAMKTSKPEKPPRFATGFDNPDPNLIPPRDWVFGQLALSKKVSLLVAPPGAGKSTLTLMIALSKVTGRDLLNINPGERGNVWIYNNEDDAEEMQRRAAAIIQHYAIPGQELYEADVIGSAHRLYIDSGENQPLRIAKRVGSNGQIKPEDAQWAIDEIRAKKIKLWIVDPFISTHPGSENDNNDIEMVADIYRRIAQKTNCSIILVHHTKKLDIASSDGHDGNLDTVRGASALGGVARIAATLFSMSAKRAKQYDIPEDQRRRYVGLSMAKANMSAIDDSMMWFEKIGERIGVNDENMDGEEVGVLRPIKFALAKVRGMSDATRALLYDVEAECLEGVRPVKEIAATLVDVYPFHQGKSGATLDRAIRRMFDDGKKSYQGKSGLVEMMEIPSAKKSGPKTVAAIQVTPFAADEESLF